MKLWPGLDEWLYAAKTFAAAMAALYIAFSIGLDRPYWAMATVYIVSQPLIGSMRSKSAYRLAGTVVAGIATLVMVPNLVNAPELLSLALALWVGVCLYVALLDRTPRSYAFLAAGFTAALIGFPTVTTPEDMWHVSLSRVEEIGLGVICTTVIGNVVFPRPLGPLLSRRILSWVASTFTWAESILDGSADPNCRTPHIGLAADAIELRMLATQLAYDTSIQQAATRWVIELEQRMVLLLPILSSIQDRLDVLRQADAIAPDLANLLDELKVWLRAGDPPPRSEADRMRALVAACDAATDPRAGWNEVIRSSLLQRLAQLVDLRQDMRDLRRHIESGGGALAAPLSLRPRRPARLHHDHGLAVLSGIAAMVTILVLCTFWIASGWAAGGSTAGLAAAGCCLFATLDDPTPALEKFLLATLLAVVFVGIGLFGILPRVHNFESLALVLGAFFVPVGVMAATPATQPLGIVLGFITATLLSLESAYSANFVTYADGGLAAILGVGTAAVVTALIRSVGAEWSARRLLRANWRDLAAIPTHRAARDSNALAGLLLDRLGLLVPRLAAVGEGNELAAVDVLADLRIGINMIDLQRDDHALPKTLHALVERVLAGTAAQFQLRAQTGHVHPPPQSLLRDIDRTLDEATTMPCQQASDLLLQLVGIRRGLFADAPPYRPAAPPADVPAAKPAAEATA
ncbi:MAG TPA: FUSC family protein [Rhodopila sp.]|jgi:uncharacterized membrane protein YccC|nr:FUSC family protein [Rhodopila sp.]